jgi:hypothetical protein
LPGGGEAIAIEADTPAAAHTARSSSFVFMTIKDA